MANQQPKASILRALSIVVFGITSLLLLAFWIDQSRSPPHDITLERAIADFNTYPDAANSQPLNSHDVELDSITYGASKATMKLIQKSPQFTIVPKDVPIAPIRNDPPAKSVPLSVQLEYLWVKSHWERFRWKRGHWRLFHVTFDIEGLDENHSALGDEC